MITYHTLPTSQKFANDMGLTGLLKRSEFPALERIIELLKLHYNLDQRLWRVQFEVRVQILMHTRYILKNASNSEKLGTSLWKKRRETVQALQDYIVRTDGDVEAGDYFGRDVDAHGQNEDQNAVAQGVQQWYTDKATRRQFKLSFRSGLANRWDLSPNGGKTALRLYDTDQWGDNLEKNMSLFAMDVKGRIYASGREGEQQLKHSSFLAGARVLAAGTIRIERGQIVGISGKSGHYKPTVQQMLNVLERLRAYQVNLNPVTVYRENYKGDYQHANPRDFEPCPAMTLLSKRAWPGVEPYSMWIG
ncbi:MAG: hypothetical protein WDZ51_13050 [Pirellulaceae bacterium]